MSICTVCQTEKPTEEFKTKTTCKSCVSDTQRGVRLKKFFNLATSEYNDILLFQNGNCAICKNPPKTVRLAVDHCHKTGLIRGLLCAMCNRAIGVFRDNVERFRSTTSYLEYPPATRVLGSPRYGLKGRVTNKAKTRDRLNKPQPGSQ